MNLFENLNSLNINKYTQEKQGLTYLNWGSAFRILEQYTETMEYEIIETEDGLTYWDTKLGLVVKTRLIVNGITKSMILPVLDFKNNQMFSSEGKMIKFGKEIDKPVATMFDINTAIMRCYVKNIAMFGLGIYIYEGYDKPETENEIDAKVINKKAIEVKAKTKLWNDFLERLKKIGVDKDDLLKENNLTMKSGDKLFDFVKTYMNKKD